jgi:hypothetical protein
MGPHAARLDTANSQDVRIAHLRWANQRSVLHFYRLLLFVHSKWMLEAECLRCCHGVPSSPKGIHSSAQGCGEVTQVTRATLGNQKPPLHPSSLKGMNNKPQVVFIPFRDGSSGTALSQGSALPHNPGLVNASPSGKERSPISRYWPSAGGGEGDLI